MHFHCALFREILEDLAKTASALPINDIAHREVLCQGAKALWQSLENGQTLGTAGGER
jgi:hypothetical protein